jgi:urease gamma subunit
VFEPISTTYDADNDVTNETGTATTVDDFHESGMATVDGIETIYEAGNVTIDDVTIETTTTDGTDLGNEEICTKTVFEPTSTTDDGANSVTYEAGTATTDETAHVSGMTTVDGTETIDDDGNETIVDVMIETTTTDGTDDGKDDHSTKTVFEPISTTDDGANDVTNETGTATTVDDLHVVGIATVDGIVTIYEAGNVTIDDVTIETTTSDGTDLGKDEI